MKKLNMPLPKAGDVWSAWVSFSDKPWQGKYRPVAIVDVDAEKCVALSVPITSTDPRINDEYDIEIYDWLYIPLEHKSTARVSKTIVIPFVDFRKKIGQVSDDDWQNITDLLMDYMRYHKI